MPEKYLWTSHSRVKMNYYRLTESRVKRIIRHPVRVEEGILEGAIACMQPADGKQYSEIWTMYVVVPERPSEKLRSDPPRRGSVSLVPACRDTVAARPPSVFRGTFLH